MTAAMHPSVSFIIKYFFIEVPSGKRLFACIYTESPEKPSANAVSARVIFLLSPEAASRLAALPISKKREKKRVMAWELNTAPINPMSAEKNMI